MGIGAQWAGRGATEWREVVEVGGLPSRLTPGSPPADKPTKLFEWTAPRSYCSVHPLKKLKYSVLAPLPTYPSVPTTVANPNYPRLTAPHLSIFRLLQILLLPFLVGTFFRFYLFFVFFYSAWCFFDLPHPFNLVFIQRRCNEDCEASFKLFPKEIRCICSLSAIISSVCLPDAIGESSIHRWTPFLCLCASDRGRKIRPPLHSFVPVKRLSKRFM